MSGKGRFYYVSRSTRRAVADVPGTTTGAQFFGTNIVWLYPCSDVCLVTAPLAGSLVDVVGDDLWRLCTRPRFLYLLSEGTL